MDITRSKILKVIGITFIWAVLGLIIALLDYATIVSVIANRYEIPNYSLTHGIRTNVFSALVGGFILISIEVFYLDESLRTEAFGKVIRTKALFYLAIIFIFTIIGSFFYSSLALDLPIYHPAVIDKTQKFLLNFGLIRNIVIWGTITIATFFFSQMNDKFGPGTLWRFITGKYHQPSNENRVFMFLDIKSSTAIAEKLGNLRYFNFLNDFYADITNAIVYNNGEIYQYVGDEVVVSWNMTEAITDSNCIKCFYDIRKSISDLRTKYIEKYGIVPEFKAGIHFGTATTGEIGVIKKEIAFSGDVMNTTARIQESCNKYGVELLISNQLRELLPKTKTYIFDRIGEIVLRGREEKIILFSVKTDDLKDLKPENLSVEHSAN